MSSFVSIVAAIFGSKERTPVSPTTPAISSKFALLQRSDSYQVTPEYPASEPLPQPIRDSTSLCEDTWSSFRRAEVERAS